MGQADRPGYGITQAEEHRLQFLYIELNNALSKALIKHAPMHSPHEGISVLREEMEELWEHVKADTGRSPEARKEAIQIAAMAMRYVLDLIDNRT